MAFSKLIYVWVGILLIHILTAFCTFWYKEKIKHNPLFVCFNHSPPLSFDEIQVGMAWNGPPGRVILIRVEVQVGEALGDEPFVGVRNDRGRVFRESHGIYLEKED